MIFSFYILVKSTVSSESRLLLRYTANRFHYNCYSIFIDFESNLECHSCSTPLSLAQRSKDLCVLAKNCLSFSSSNNRKSHFLFTFLTVPDFSESSFKNIKPGLLFPGNGGDFCFFIPFHTRSPSVTSSTILCTISGFLKAKRSMRKHNKRRNQRHFSF